VPLSRTEAGRFTRFARFGKNFPKRSVSVMTECFFLRGIIEKSGQLGQSLYQPTSLYRDKASKIKILLPKSAKIGGVFKDP
jgi:hypothetical protein